MAAEKQFEQRVKKYLESIGCYALGTPSDKMPVPPLGYWEKRHADAFTKSGLPDMHVTLCDVSVEVELKAENGRPSELQKLNLNQINRAGAYGVTLYPSGFEDFKRFCRILISDGYVRRDEFQNILKQYSINVGV